MQSIRTSLLTLVLFLFIWTMTFGQDIDKDLIVGKWKFVKATMGPMEKDYQYNGDPLVTFERNGKWITEDYNPKYRQSGSWKIENKVLIRDPELSGMGDVEPYQRGIEKLTNTELVLYALSPGGLRTITFYFTRL